MSRFFINRPIVAMVISDPHGDRRRGHHRQPSRRRSFPAIAPPEVQVQTTYVGADAQTLEQSVATPIEQQMSGVDNMNYMYSLNSSTGEMRLIVDFDVQTDPNTDLILAQLRQTQAASQLPAEVTNFGVTVQKIADRAADADQPVFAAAAPTTRSSWRTTPTSTSTISSRASRASAASRSSAPASTPCGFGSSPISWRSWRSPSRRSSRAIQSQNTVNPAGQVGGEPAPQGAGVHLLGARAGPADVAGRIRADRRSRDAGRRHRARQGRRAGRTRRAGLHRRRPPERTSRARSSRSISCPDRTPCKRPTGSRSCWPSNEAALPARTSTTRSRSTPRARSPKASRRSSRRC